MEAYLSKACWRAGAKLLAGFAVIGAVVGVRLVTATPTGIEADLAELEQLEVELAAGSLPAAESEQASMAGDAEPIDAAAGTASSGSANRVDLDRMVRCRLAAGTQFMRAADCATRGGRLEELPPPEPEDPTAAQATP